MPNCAILQCKNNSQWRNLSNGGVSYHRFPKDPFVKDKWITATGRPVWMPLKFSTICSEHFQEEDFLTSAKGRRYLKTTAVPTVKIVIFYDHQQNVNAATSNSTKRQVFESCFCEDSGPVIPQKVGLDEVSVPTVEDTPGCSQNVNTKKPHCTVKLSVGPSQSKTEDGEASSNSLSRKLKIRERFRWSQEKIKKQSLKIRRLQAQNRRYKKKITNIEEILKNLTQKFVNAKEKLIKLNVDINDSVEND